MCNALKGYNNLCKVCMQDCKSVNKFNNCQYFKDAPSIEAYWDLINQENINLKSLCNEYGVCLNTMYKMLNGEYIMTYKYHTILLARLTEIEEFEKCWDRFEVENE